MALEHEGCVWRTTKGTMTKHSEMDLAVGDQFHLGRTICHVTQISGFGGVPHYGFRWLTDSGEPQAGWMPVEFVDNLSGHDTTACRGAKLAGRTLERVAKTSRSLPAKALLTEAPMSDPRLDELLERLVAPGRPHDKFSASEFHELYDAVTEKLALFGELVGALRLILPMALGYAHAHPVGNNAKFIEEAAQALANTKEV